MSTPWPARHRRRERISVRRHFHRDIDIGWRRTSYSALIRDAEYTGVGSEPEIDRQGRRGRATCRWPRPNLRGADVPSPMADLPTRRDVRLTGARGVGDRGSAGGRSRRGVGRTDRRAQHVVAGGRLGRRAGRRAGTAARHLAGPAGRTGSRCARSAWRNRLRELDFEIPLAGGDLVRSDVADIRLADVGHLLRDAPGRG